MNRDQYLQAWPIAVAPNPADRSAVPILIQVPRVSVYSRPSSRRSTRATARPRRRLRREVRWALYVMLAALPPVLSALAYWEGRHAALLEIRAPHSVDAAPEAAPEPEPLPPRISLSIEPAVPLPPAEPAAPVIIPGYLLPDDGLEEPAHARD
ncbi:MAG: hypothetical protein P4L84_10800 [Isosphaeraceae bacterium]|nr:hypothetical protein [Isosphaeraceae bacterium]